MVGRIVAHYEILEKLGEGGMGVVYRARDTRLGRLVALKALPAPDALNSRRRARFVLEAKAASALNHPNIITVYGIENFEGVDYIAMEYVQGEMLLRLIGPRGMRTPDALNYSIQIAAGLAAAHAAGIVHRDIKPSNVMVTKSGLIKILDFGVARIQARGRDAQERTWTIPPEAFTQPGALVGSAPYMAPEQIQEKEADQRADLFSFGVLLYQMLTGERPFQGSSEMEVMFNIVHAPAPAVTEKRPDVPLRLAAILETALEKDPERRYQHADDVLRDLQMLTREWESGITVTQPALVRLQIDLAKTAPEKKAFWKRPWMWAAAGVLAVVTALAVWQAAPRWFTRVPAEKRIAVLPFRNVGNAPENQALCDGLMEALTSELTELEQFQGTLWVVPSTEVRREQLSSAEGARRALGANLVIVGSVQRDAQQVYLTASVVDAKTLRQLSSRSFRRDLAEFADLQESVVREIARMLELHLGSNESQVLATRETKAAGAYDFYLQAQGYLQRRSVEDLDHAIDLLNRAVAQDPNYVLASAGLGEAYWKKYRLTNDTQWVEPAERNCDRALALNDRVAAVHVTQGIVQEGTGRHEEAVRSFRRALALDPINASAYSELGNAYEAMGKLEEAEATFKKAAQLRPNDFTSMNDLGLFYYRRGRYQDAAPIIRRITQLVPDNSSGYTNLGAVYWMDGKYAEAAASYEQSLALRPTASAYSSLGTVYFFLDRCAEAVPLMEKATELLPRNDQVWSNLGDVYACSPNGRDKAAEAYRRAAQLGQERLTVNPQDAETVSRVALYAARLGDTIDAIAKTKQAAKLAPSSRSVAWHATLAYELAGQRDLALEALKAALRAGQPAQEVEHEPTLKKLRTDVRYTRLMPGAPER